MSLRDYLKSLSKEEQQAFADGCGTSIAQLRQIAGNFRTAAERLTINIERESGGKVTCESLRPDVDWSYIRGTACAPNTKKKTDCGEFHKPRASMQQRRSAI